MNTMLLGFIAKYSVPGLFDNGEPWYDWARELSAWKKPDPIIRALHIRCPIILPNHSGHFEFIYSNRTGKLEAILTDDHGIYF